MPDLPSPIQGSASDRRLERAVREVLREPPGSRQFMKGSGTIRDLEFERIRTVIDLGRISIGWPAFLFIPSQADYKQYWAFPPPASNRYALDWEHHPIGVTEASREDGRLWVWTPSPTVGGAIDGKAEAGLGVLFSPKHTLSRIQVEPELVFTGRHAWSVNVDPVVWVHTRVIGSIYVGAFLQNPISGGYESVPNVAWRRHVVFDESNSGAGASAMVTVPFHVKGQAASAQVLVEAGRTYLLAVVAQMVLRIRTTNSAGRPVKVTNGRFDTWGSLAGMVPEIWLDQTVLIQ